MTRSPLVSVVVPMYMEAQALPVTLPSIRTAADRIPGGAEILVAAGPSPDGSRALAERLLRGAPYRIVDVAQGKFEALRHAVGEAVGPILLLVDADVTVSAEAFALLVGHLGRGADVCQARGTCMRAEAPGRIGGWLERWQAHMDAARDRLRAARPEYLWLLAGGLYAIRAGLFPARAIVPVLDDHSMGWHAWRQGARFRYEPRAVWSYRPPRTPAGWLRQKLRTRWGIARFCRLEPAARPYFADLLAEYGRPGHGTPWLRASVVGQERLIRLLGRVLDRIAEGEDRWTPLPDTKAWSAARPDGG